MKDINSQMYQGCYLKSSFEQTGTIKYLGNVLHVFIAQYKPDDSVGEPFSQNLHFFPGLVKTKAELTLLFIVLEIHENVALCMLVCK